MKKRLLSGLLSLALVCSLVPAALAAAVVPDEQEAAQVLAALDILVGDENGDLNLNKAVSRAEFIKMAVAATPAGKGVGTASTSPYPDVPRGHWAAGYVQNAVETGLVTGYLDGTFRPGNTITLAEGVTVVLRLLGWQNADFSGAYPSGQMAKYRDLKLDRGVTAGQNDNLSRRDCLYLFYNLLTAPAKTTGQAYIYALGHGLNAAGEVDRVALINSVMEGPVVVSDGWQDKVSFDPASARTVYRGGRASSYDALQLSDVVYWSKSMGTLWAYTDKASGTITAITPTSAPTSVTVAGQSYPIETSAAAYALSDLGSFRTGDTVTLLLGRSGGVAAVVDGEVSQVLYGLVESAAPAPYTDFNGNSYTANTLTLRLTDGSQRSFRCDDTDIEPGDLVKVTSSGGSLTIKPLSKTSLTGKVSTDGSKLGNKLFAQDAEILDTYGNTALRVWPSRLAGVSLDSGDVAFYALNADGQITHLILEDVTGDLHRYGVLTDVTEIDGGMTLMGSYVYDIGGQSIPTGPLSKLFGVKEGPAKFVYQNGGLKAIANLLPVKLTSLSGSQGFAEGKTWALSETAAVYELRDGEYYLSSQAIVEQGDWSLTGWYDTAPGSRIRVIVARDKA